MRVQVCNGDCDGEKRWRRRKKSRSRRTEVFDIVASRARFRASPLPTSALNRGVHFTSQVGRG